jgi:chemotaxis protein methyltransferase CheR
MRLGSSLAGRARELVAGRLGLHFGEDRHAEMDRALLETAGLSGQRTLEEWLAGLASRPLTDPAWMRLIARLTTGETYFWRDHAVFEALEQHVLPDLLAARRSRRALRVWSAACSTGEEPYSLAILLDRLLLDRAAWDLTVLATDLNPASLETARRGLYRPWALRDVPAAVRERYFRGQGARGIEVDPEIRQLVHFETTNLVEPFPPSVTGAPMDLILCRNVLMYLTPEAAARVVVQLRAALAEDGWLLVAPAEASAEAFRPLRPVNFTGAIFFRAGAAPEEPRETDPAVTPRPARRLEEARPKRDPAARRTRAPPAPRPPPDQPSPAELKARAQALADGGNLDEARRWCQRALAGDRLDAGAYRLLAAIEQERGRTAASIDALRRALYLEPDTSEVHLALGRLLLARGERRSALRHLATAERLRLVTREAS